MRHRCDNLVNSGKKNAHRAKSCVTVDCICFCVFSKISARKHSSTLSSRYFERGTTNFSPFLGKCYIKPQTIKD